MEENPNNTYKIVYSNSFYFEGELLAFRKKLLFNISSTPKLVPYNEKCSCWIINRKQLTFSKAKSLVTKNKIEVDVSELQWFNQINLDHVFNL